MCPLCNGHDDLNHETECPLGLLMRWQAFTQSTRLTRTLLLLNADNSASLRELKETLATIGGAERQELQFFAGMAEDIFTIIRQAIQATATEKPNPNLMDGRKAPPPVNTSMPEEAKGSVRSVPITEKSKVLSNLDAFKNSLLDSDLGKSLDPYLFK
jgi:hypothetical protein